MYARVWRGLRATLPVALGIAPFGLAYGAVAIRGMAFWQGMLMSLTVFAGTAQFVVANMLLEGAAYLPVLLTGILINLRHVLMGAALAPHIWRAPSFLRPLLPHLMTDESFAVSMAEFEGGRSDPLFFAGSGLAVYGIWQLSTLAGLTLGGGLPAGFGLEYALPGSLVGVLFLLVRERRGALVALLAAALSVLLRPMVSGTWSALVATFVAASLGVAWRRRRSRS